MVTYFVMEMMTMRSTMIGQGFDTMIVQHVIKSGYYDPLKVKSRKILKTVLSPLYVFLDMLDSGNKSFGRWYQARCEGVLRGKLSCKCLYIF